MDPWSRQSVACNPLDISFIIRVHVLAADAHVFPFLESCGRDGGWSSDSLNFTTHLSFLQNVSAPPKKRIKCVTAAMSLVGMYLGLKYQLQLLTHLQTPPDWLQVFLHSGLICLLIEAAAKAHERLRLFDILIVSKPQGPNTNTHTHSGGGLGPTTDIYRPDN